MSHRFLLAICTLVVPALACNVFVGGPPPPEPPISNSAESLNSFQAQLEQAVVDGLINGSLSLSISQEQLTAYLASRLSAQPHPILTAPQVALQDEQMIVYGRTKAWIFEANAALTAQFSVDEAGLPRIEISRAQVGPLPMPRALRDAIAAAIDEALTGYIGPVAIGFRLESIHISEGSMTITGRIR